jgi:hypothetical protein
MVVALLAGCGANTRGTAVKTQAQAQDEAVAAARQFVTATGITVTEENYVLGSCGDSGCPPFNPTVTGLFDRPADTTQALAMGDTYRQRLIAAGWSTQDAGISHSAISLTKDGFLLQMDAVWLPTSLPKPVGGFEWYGPFTQVEGVNSQADVNAIGGDITALLK